MQARLGMEIMGDRRQEILGDQKMRESPCAASACTIGGNAA